MFPKGSHDDQIDAVVDAHQHLADYEDKSYLNVMPVSGERVSYWRSL